MTVRVNRMAEELRTKERIKDTFGKYLDPRVVARLIDTSKDDMDQAERRVATVLFSYLKGFELLGRAGEVEAGLLELRDLYVTGLAAYRRQEWDTAEQRFAECLRQCPGDGPAAVLRERSVAFRATPPPPDWGGVWHLNEK